jgi:hypothetical protein
MYMPLTAAAAAAAAECAHILVLTGAEMILLMYNVLLPLCDAGASETKAIG